MKKLFVIGILFLAASTVAIAGPTKAQVQSAITSSRPTLSSKIATMEANLSSNASNMQQSVNDVYNELKRDLQLTQNLLDLESKANQPTLNTRYLKLEKYSHQFQQLMSDINNNKAQLIKAAKDFKDLY